jgi:hypothetical protein
VTDDSGADPEVASLKLLEQRDDLKAFGEHAFVLLALETRFEIEDIVTEADTALTDGERDKKCDVLYVDRESRTAVICQAYFATGSKTNPPANKASDLNTAVSWILGDGDPNALGPELAAARDELIDAIENADVDDIELWYCHNLAGSDVVAAELGQAAQSARAMLAHRFPDVDINVRGVEVTPDVVDDWLKKTHYQVLIRDTLEVPTNTWMTESGSAWKAALTTVSASWLKHLYDEYGSERLFAGNVRGELAARRSATDINFGIRTTATSRPEQFWAYNNGITALVTRIDEDGSTLRVRGITIVNGAQTTGSLALSGAAELDLERVRVMIRFIESTDREVIRDISTYNNTQNEIKPSDFRSSDPVQTRLVSEFKVIPEVTYWGPRRGGPGQGPKKPSNMLEADLVAQALASFHGRPEVAYHEKNQIWRDNSLYAQFFSDKTTAGHAVLCVGLIRATRALKASVRALSARTASQAKVEEFFSYRGSDFLFSSAVASCIEDILDRPVADKWSLTFGTLVSPVVGVEYWSPVVEALSGFVTALSPAAPSGNLRNTRAVGEAIESFQAFVSGTRQSNAELFKQFAVHVEGS